MRNKLWPLCFLSLFSIISIAQETPISSEYSFTLNEAIEYGTEHSYTSINARREVAKALQLKWETTANGLPQINASVDYQNQLKQPVSVIPSEFFGGEAGTFTPVVFSVQQQASLTATLSQLIFDGSYLVALEAAKSFLQFNYDSEEKELAGVKKSIINAYGSVLVAKESVKILKKNTATLQKNLDESKKILENGLNEEEDVEQLQITLLQITNQLNNAERLEKIALQMLNVTLGIDVDANTILTDTLETLTMKNIDPSITTSNFNMENNIDYRLAYLFTEQRRLELKLEKSKALPTISAFVNYGTSAFDDDFVFLDSSTPWFQSSILGASINIPIFSSLGRSAKTKQAKIAFEQSNTDFIQAQQQIQLQYNSAVGDYKLSLENYDALQQNLTLAERIEKKNQIKYNEGLTTSFELRQAQLQLYNAQQEVLQAMLTIINNKATLESILNTPNN